MVNRRNVFAVASLIAAASASAGANAEVLRLWPAPYQTLWGLEHTNCKPQKGAADGQIIRSAKIHPDLCPVFNDPRVTPLLVEQFEKELRDKVPNVISDLKEGLAAGVPVEDALRQTLIASLHISRSDLWRVEKGKTVDIFLPFTLTVNFTNASSGEVVFTASESVIPQGTFPASAAGVAEARGQLTTQLSKAITNLVDKASASYKPYPLAAKVREKDGDKTFIIDKGRLAGMRTGERIGTDATIEFADANYSVIRAGLFPIQVGDDISKSAATPVSALSRPSVFVVVTNVPADKSASYLRLLFEQRLGQGNALTVMPGNESFTQIRRLMLQKAAAPSVELTQRPLPEYLLRIQVFDLPSTKLDTNLPGIKLHSYQAYATAELTDRSGRVVFATTADNRIDDQVAAGIAFSDDARHDTVVSNALQQLADKISAGFKPRALRLTVKSTAGGFMLDDAGGSIGAGAVGLVLRKKGRVTGVEGDVWSPVGPYRLDPSAEGGLQLRGSGLGASKLRDGDAFSYESGSPNIVSRLSYSQCASVPLPELSVDTKVLAAIAGNRFMSSFQAPTYLADFGPVLRDYMDDFSQERLTELSAINRPPTDRCFVPVVRVLPGADAPAKGGTLVPTATVATGFMLKAGDTRLAASGTQLQLKGSSLPATATQSERDVSIVRDAVSVVIQLADQWGKANKPPQ